MAITTIDELFLHGLQDIYYAEHQIAKALKAMLGRRIEISLYDTIEHHLEDMDDQIQRLEKIFRALGHEPQGVTCQAILGLIEEGDELANEVEDENLRDAALLASAQAIGGYEIARYTTLLTWADRLGPGAIVDPKPLRGLDIVDLLQLSLDEEKNQDARLAVLAESRISGIAA